MSEEKTLMQSVVQALTDLVSEVPASKETPAEHPAKRAEELTFSAKVKAAAISGTLALPPGPAGRRTIQPDRVAIRRNQRQLVADIAASFGRQADLSREAMLYCLFRHAASQAVRDLLVRVGQRVLIRRASLRVMQQVLEKVGIKVTQRVLGRAVSRWVPILGAVGVAAYAWHDTGQVGETALDFFSHLENSPDPD